ncbi:tigger transposable element-derived protein 1-like [Palaemon carinicauda]|uniref:tigger transposable element-derived protein 1-like n=1 Tax=Palaemon carinicauda TaxID=392227 RepID=UPI0035B58F64
MKRPWRLSRSTVATILKVKERIAEHVKGSAPIEATLITKQCSGLIIEMERLLVPWLEDQNQWRISVSQEKAKRLFEALKKKGGKKVKEEFSASRGWFMRFKARANYHNLEVQGEAASEDEKAASEFPKALAEIIREGLFCLSSVHRKGEVSTWS